MRSGQDDGDDQADGAPRPLTEDMEWSRLQGLYGGSEYGGYVGDPDRPDRSHAGKGPRGWQRTDDRLLDQVSEALARHPAIDASDLEVAVDGSRVILRGEVSDQRTRQLAKECAEGIAGVDDVQDQLRVRQGPGDTQGGGRRPPPPPESRP
jgi:hypothetical protein